MQIIFSFGRRRMRLTYLSSVMIVEIVVFLRGGAVDLRTLLARPTHLVEQRATPAQEPMVYHPVDRQPFLQINLNFKNNSFKIKIIKLKQFKLK